MPRAGDAFLAGPVPQTHNPLQRINQYPPKLLLDPLTILQQTITWFETYGLDALQQVLGFNLGAGIPLDSAEVVAEIVSAIQAFIITPVSQISNTIFEQLRNGGFNDPTSFVDDTGKWLWDNTVGLLGSVSTLGDGTTHSLISNIIPVAPDQVMNVSVLTQWADLVGGGQPIQLNLLTLFDNVVQDTVLIDAIPPGWAPDSDGWTTLSGVFTVPAGVNQVVTKPTVTDQATAGTVWFGQASTTKTGVLQQAWVGGLVQNFEDILGFGAGSAGSEFPHAFPVGFGTQSDLGRMFDNWRAMLPGIDLLDPLFDQADAFTKFITGGLIPQNLLGVLDPTSGKLLDVQAPQVLNDIVAAMQQAFDDAVLGGAVSQLEQNVWDVINGLLGVGSVAQQSATNNATTLAALTAKVNTVGLAGTPVSVSDNFGAAASDSLPAPWDVTYTPGGTGMTLGVDGQGHTQWRNTVTQQVTAVCRYPTALATNTQYVSWVIKEKQSNIPGPSDAFQGGCGRMNAAMTDYVPGFVEGGGGFSGNSPSVAHLGFVLSGVYTELDYTDVFTAAGDTWELFIGTLASAREFVLKRNGMIVLQATDGGATSAMDASHLFTGFVQATGVGNGPFLIPQLNLPATFDGFSASDVAAA